MDQIYRKNITFILFILIAFSSCFEKGMSSVHTHFGKCNFQKWCPKDQICLCGCQHICWILTYPFRTQTFLQPSVSLRTMSYIHYRLSITLNQQLLLKKLVHTNLSELGLAEMLWKWEVKLKSLFAYLEYAQNFIILSNYLAPLKGKIKWHVWNITPDL